MAKRTYIRITNVPVNLKEQLNNIAQNRYETPLAKFLKEELQKIADAYPPQDKLSK